MGKKSSLPGVIVLLVSVLAVAFSLWHFYQHHEAVLAKEGKEVFPIWFSFEGKVLRSRESCWFWVYPAMAIIFFSLFYTLINRQDLWKFPVVITPLNKVYQYTVLRAFILRIQFWFFCMLAYSQYYVVEIVLRETVTEIPRFSQQIAFSVPLFFVAVYLVNVLVPPSE